MADYTGSGSVTISGEATTYSTEYYLLDFTPLSRDRRYNAGLDENNKYPEDYLENYADLFRK
jgi:hypothetical protein